MLRNSLYLPFAEEDDEEFENSTDEDETNESSINSLSSSSSLLTTSSVSLQSTLSTGAILSSSDNYNYDALTQSGNYALEHSAPDEHTTETHKDSNITDIRITVQNFEDEFEDRNTQLLSSHADLRRTRYHFNAMDEEYDNEELQATESEDEDGSAQQLPPGYDAEMEEYTEDEYDYDNDNAQNAIPSGYDAEFASDEEYQTTNNNNNNEQSFDGYGLEGIVRFSNPCNSNAHFSTSMLNDYDEDDDFDDDGEEDEVIAPEPMAWNEKFQEIVDMPAFTAEQHLERFQQLRALVHSFLAYTKIIAKQIVEGKLEPSTSYGGTAGGLKFEDPAKTTFFKYALDQQVGNYWVYGKNHEYAMKVANNELRAMQALLNCRIEGIYYPLVALIDYAGRRLIAQSILPLEPKSKNNRKKATTLVYGSQDGGRTVTNKLREVDLHVYSALKRAARSLNLQPHRVGVKTMKNKEDSKTLLFCGDIEIHQGLDGKYYCLDTARLFPPAVVSAKPCTGKRQADFLCYLLRPELVKNNPVPLSSDAFSGFQFWDKKKHQFNLEAKNASLRLVKDVIRSLADQLNCGQVTIVDTTELVACMHKRGINIRYLGKLRSLIKPENQHLRHLILLEMVTRVAKNRLRRKMRANSTKANNHKFSKQKLYATVVEYFNLVLGKQEGDNASMDESNPHAVEWQALRSHIVEKFDFWKPNESQNYDGNEFYIEHKLTWDSLTPEEIQMPAIQLRNSFKLFMLFERLQNTTGISFKEEVRQTFLDTMRKNWKHKLNTATNIVDQHSNLDTTTSAEIVNSMDYASTPFDCEQPLTANDIKEIIPKVKHWNFDFSIEKYVVKTVRNELEAPQSKTTNEIMNKLMHEKGSIHHSLDRHHARSKSITSSNLTTSGSIPISPAVARSQSTRSIKPFQKHVITSENEELKHEQLQFSIMCYDKLKKILGGSHHPLVREANRKIIENYTQLQCFVQAMQYMQAWWKSFASNESKHGNEAQFKRLFTSGEYLQCLTGLVTIGELYEARGQVDNAIKYYNIILCFTQIMYTRHPIIANIYYKLANLQSSLPQLLKTIAFNTNDIYAIELDDDECSQEELTNKLAITRVTWLELAYIEYAEVYVRSSEQVELLLALSHAYTNINKAKAKSCLHQAYTLSFGKGTLAHKAKMDKILRLIVLLEYAKFYLHSNSDALLSQHYATKALKLAEKSIANSRERASAKNLFANPENQFCSSSSLYASFATFSAYEQLSLIHAEVYNLLSEIYELRGINSVALIFLTRSVLIYDRTLPPGSFEVLQKSSRLLQMILLSLQYYLAEFKRSIVVALVSEKDSQADANSHASNELEVLILELLEKVEALDSLLALRSEVYLPRIEEIMHHCLKQLSIILQPKPTNFKLHYCIAITALYRVVEGLAIFQQKEQAEIQRFTDTIHIVEGNALAANFRYWHSKSSANLNEKAEKEIPANLKRKKSKIARTKHIFKSLTSASVSAQEKVQPPSKHASFANVSLPEPEIVVPAELEEESCALIEELQSFANIIQKIGKRRLQELKVATNNILQHRRKNKQRQQFTAITSQKTLAILDMFQSRFDFITALLLISEKTKVQTQQNLGTSIDESESLYNSSEVAQLVDHTFILALHERVEDCSDFSEEGRQRIERKWEVVKSGSDAFIHAKQNVTQLGLELGLLLQFDHYVHFQTSEVSAHTSDLRASTPNSSIFAPAMILSHICKESQHRSSLTNNVVLNYNQPSLVSVNKETSNATTINLTDSFTINIAYEEQSQRLYLYSSLLDTIPTNIELKIKLFTTLLQGSLLGAEMAGGGVGIATNEQQDKQTIVLHCPLEMTHASPFLLKEFSSVFIKTVEKWRLKAEQVVSKQYAEELLQFDKEIQQDYDISKVFLKAYKESNKEAIQLLASLLKFLVDCKLSITSLDTAPTSIEPTNYLPRCCAFLATQPAQLLQDSKVIQLLSYFGFTISTNNCLIFSGSVETLQQQIEQLNALQCSPETQSPTKIESVEPDNWEENSEEEFDILLEGNNTLADNWNSNSPVKQSEANYYSSDDDDNQLLAQITEKEKEEQQEINELIDQFLKISDTSDRSIAYKYIMKCNKDVDTAIIAFLESKCVVKVQKEKVQEQSTNPKAEIELRSTANSSLDVPAPKSKSKKNKFINLLGIKKEKDKDTNVPQLEPPVMTTANTTSDVPTPETTTSFTQEQLEKIDTLQTVACISNQQTAVIMLANAQWNLEQAVNNALLADADNQPISSNNSSSTSTSSTSTIDDILANFQAITGLYNEYACRNLLATANWDLERAVSAYFSQDDASSHSNHTDLTHSAELQFAESSEEAEVQSSQVVKFKTITGIADTALCFDILSSCEWNLQAAIECALASETQDRNEKIGSKIGFFEDNGLLHSHQNLERLASALGIDNMNLQLDEDNTCIITIQPSNDLIKTLQKEFVMHCTYEEASKKMFIYSTILENIPVFISKANPHESEQFKFEQHQRKMLNMYEMLLEGSLLGQEIAGGGCGISSKDNVILLHVAVEMEYASPSDIRVLTPKFVATVLKWRNRIQECLASNTTKSHKPSNSINTAIQDDLERLQQLLIRFCDHYKQFNPTVLYYLLAFCRQFSKAKYLITDSSKQAQYSYKPTMHILSSYLEMLFCIATNEQNEKDILYLLQQTGLQFEIDLQLNDNSDPIPNLFFELVSHHNNCTNFNSTWKLSLQKLKSMTDSQYNALHNRILFVVHFAATYIQLYVLNAEVNGNLNSSQQDFCVQVETAVGKFISINEHKATEGLRSMCVALSEVECQLQNAAALSLSASPFYSNLVITATAYHHLMSDCGILGISALLKQLGFYNSAHQDTTDSTQASKKKGNKWTKWSRKFSNSYEVKRKQKPTSIFELQPAAEHKLRYGLLIIIEYLSASKFSTKPSMQATVNDEQPSLSPPIIDTQPEANAVDFELSCSKCQQSVKGILYKCAQCSAFLLCETCELQQAEEQYFEYVHKHRLAQSFVEPNFKLTRNVSSNKHDISHVLVKYHSKKQLNAKISLPNLYNGEEDWLNEAVTSLSLFTYKNHLLYCQACCSLICSATTLESNSLPAQTTSQSVALSFAVNASNASPAQLVNNSVRYLCLDCQLFGSCSVNLCASCEEKQPQGAALLAKEQLMHTLEHRLLKIYYPLPFSHFRYSPRISAKSFNTSPVPSDQMKNYFIILQTEHKDNNWLLMLQKKYDFAVIKNGFEYAIEQNLHLHLQRSAFFVLAVAILTSTEFASGSVNLFEKLLFVDKTSNKGSARLQLLSNQFCCSLHSADILGCFAYYNEERIYFILNTLLLIINNDYDGKINALKAICNCLRNNYITGVSLQLVPNIVARVLPILIAQPIERNHEHAKTATVSQVQQLETRNVCWRILYHVTDLKLTSCCMPNTTQLCNGLVVGHKIVNCLLTTLRLEYNYEILAHAAGTLTNLAENKQLYFIKEESTVQHPCYASLKTYKKQFIKLLQKHYKSPSNMVCIHTSHALATFGEQRPLTVILNQQSDKIVLCLHHLIKYLFNGGRIACNRAKGVIGVLLRIATSFTKPNCSTHFTTNPQRLATIALAIMAKNSMACNISISNSLVLFSALLQPTANSSTTPAFSSSPKLPALLRNTFNATNEEATLTTLIHNKLLAANNNEASVDYKQICCAIVMLATTVRNESSYSDATEHIPASAVNYIFENLVFINNSHKHLWAFWALSSLARNVFYVHKDIYMHCNLIVNKLLKSPNYTIKCYAAQTLYWMLFVKKNKSDTQVMIDLLLSKLSSLLDFIAIPCKQQHQQQQNVQQNVQQHVQQHVQQRDAFPQLFSTSTSTTCSITSFKRHCKVLIGMVIHSLRSKKHKQKRARIQQQVIGHKAFSLLLSSSNVSFLQLDTAISNLLLLSNLIVDTTTADKNEQLQLTIRKLVASILQSAGSVTNNVNTTTTTTTKPASFSSLTTLALLFAAQEDRETKKMIIQQTTVFIKQLASENLEIQIFTVAVLAFLYKHHYHAKHLESQFWEKFDELNKLKLQSVITAAEIDERLQHYSNTLHLVPFFNAWPFAQSNEMRLSLSASGYMAQSTAMLDSSNNRAFGSRENLLSSLHFRNELAITEWNIEDY